MYFFGSEACQSFLDVMWIQEAANTTGDFNWIIAKTFIMEALSPLENIGSSNKVEINN